MYQTTYHRPATLAEARSLASEMSEAVYMSGGHTLIPAMKSRLAAPEHVIDLRRIPEMHGISVAPHNVYIGAATPHATVAASREVRGAIPVLAGLAGSIGDRQVRHVGTIGGSVANNDPAADYPSAVLALGATVHTDRREMAADDFFTGLYETAREPDEILTGFSFPIPQVAAYAKLRNAASRYAIAGVFLARLTDGTVRVAVTGAGNDGVFRPAVIEAALSADFSPEALDGIEIDPAGLMSDIHATAEYRAHLVVVLAKRAMQNPGAAVVLR